MKYDKYRKNGAYHYQWYDDPNWAWYKECVDRCVEFCKGDTLDVGCGDGLLVKKIADKGYEVEGVDNEASAITAAEKYVSGYCRVEDLNNMRAKEYEYMACLNVIEHLKSPDGLINILRHYITKGAIIITDEAREHKGRYHEHEYTLPELVETFKEFKPKPFKIESTEFGKPITFIGVEITK